MALASQLVDALRHPKWRRALLLALASDALSFGLALAWPVQVAVDLATAAVLFILLGARWGLAIPLVIEAIPGLAIFPAWSVVILGYAAAEPRSRYPGMDGMPPPKEEGDGQSPGPKLPG